MPQGQIIGRVAVKVLPDTDTFRRDAQKALDKIEKELDFNLKLVLDTKDLKQQLQKIKEELKHWRDQNDPLKIGISLEMLAGHTTAVNARLAYLTRPRTVTIIPILNKPAVANVMTALAALSGGRVLGDLLRKMKEIGTEFDRWAPKVGAAAAALGGLASLALTSVSNFTALSLSLAQMATATFALPGLFAGLAVGLGVTVVALTGLKKALPDVFKQFADMKNLIVRDFWSTAATGIRQLATVYLPQLASTAKGLGAFWGNLAGALAKPFKTALPKMMDDLNRSISITAGASSVFASIITSLGLTGSQYLPRLASWFVDISKQFDAFLTKASSDGSLKAWIESGIQGLKDVGSIFINAGKIIGDIGKAAQAGGGSTLSILADTMERIRAVTASPEFQKTMTAVFKTAHDVMSSIATTAGPAFLKLIGSLADTFQKIGPALGTGLGVALAAIGDALSSPAFQGAIVTVFQGLADAIVALAPAVQPIADAIGALAPVFSALLGVIAPLISAALAPLAAIIAILAPAIIPVVDLLGSALLDAINLIAPVLITLATLIAPIIGQLVDGLTPILGILVQSFGDLLTGLVPLLPMFTELWLSILVPLMPVIQQLAATLLPMLVQVFLAVAQALAPLYAALIGVINLIMPVLVPVLTFLIGVLSVGLTAAINLVVGIFQGAMKMLTGIFQGFKALFTGDWDGMWKAIALIMEGAGQVLRSLLDGILSFFTRMPDQVKGAFGNAKDILLDVGRKIIDGLLEGIGNGFQAVKDKLGELTDLLPDWKGPAKKDATLLTDAGALIIDGFINGLESRYDAVKKSLGGLTNDVAGMGISGLGNALNGAVNGSLGDGTPIKVLNYYAAAGSSLNAEEDLFTASHRARMVAW